MGFGFQKRKRLGLLRPVAGVLWATALVACSSDEPTRPDTGREGALNALDFSAAGVEDLCLHRIDAVVQEVAPAVFEFDSVGPGEDSGTVCWWAGPGDQLLAAEFLTFPFEGTVEDGDDKRTIAREEYERAHQYTARPDLVDKLGGTGVYMRHDEGFHTVMVFARDRGASFTTIGPVPLSDSQLETLALSLAPSTSPSTSESSPDGP
jgi:hypothetical protein